MFHYFEAVREDVRARNTQGVTQVNLNTAIFSAMDVPLPPLGVQRRIADVLDRAAALRVKRRAAIALLDTMTDAAEAIAVFARHGDDIHLLVTDVVMPQMNGRQLAERFLAERPALKVLYMSGYTDEPVNADDASAAAAFLQKPFTPDVLARTVRDVLDGKPPAA